MSASLHILAPAAFAEAFLAIGDSFDGGEVRFTFGPAAGARPDSLVSQLIAGHPADLVVLPKPVFEAQQQAGRLAGGAGTPVAVSRTAFCVSEGSPLPDLATTDALRDALRAAPAVAISAAGSGVYFTGTLLPALGLDVDAVRVLTAADRPVAELVAAGEATLGFQQRAELTGQRGIALVPDLPDLAQHETVLVAAAPAAVATTALVRAFLAHITSAGAVSILDRFGLDG